ncbi:MAG TPA: carbohydrate kinase family protein [Terriglobales bacterium]|nr:carbohydrate kinase family protein [Terriglobales bacterium]
MASSPGTHGPTLVVVGEFFLDLIFYALPDLPRLGEEVKTRHFAQLPGGGLATTSLVASRLGTRTAAIARVGEDVRSSPAWRSLGDNKVSMDACEYASALPTARTVCAAFNGDRMMITHDTINQHLEKLLSRPAAQQALRNARHVHLACALWPIAAWLPWIKRLRAQRLSVSADIGWNPEMFRSQDLSRLLRQLDFLFPNEVEARAITNEKTTERALKKLAEWMPVPLIKLGPAGSVAIQNGKVLRVASLPVRSIDATGAGDAFNGGFLHGYLAGWDLGDCLRAGNVCGALATTGAGGSSVLPSAAKLRKLMGRLKSNSDQMDRHRN